MVLKCCVANCKNRAEKGRIVLFSVPIGKCFIGIFQYLLIFIALRYQKIIAATEMA
jgi:hypothetical protein